MYLIKNQDLPERERSPSRSSSSPPAEAGLVGRVVWITGTSLPPSKSNKSFACKTKKKRLISYQKEVEMGLENGLRKKKKNQEKPNSDGTECRGMSSDNSQIAQD